MRPRLNTPQLIIMAFVLSMFVCAAVLQIPIRSVISDSLVRLVMNGVLVLSLIPMVNAGIGMNFGLPVGITAGLLGMCLAVNFRLAGIGGFACAMLFSAAIGVFFGWPYARVLNRVKGREEIASTFIGFSFVYLMCMFWAVAPFENPAMLWPIGGEGMRPTIGLNGFFARALNSLWSIDAWGIVIPVGLLLAFGCFCGLLGLFTRTKLGKAVSAVGENETFAVLSGIDVMKTRTIAVIASTVLGALGICVYSQSYGFIELYDRPLMMAFPAISALLIGGSNGHKASVWQMILGTYLFQTLYILSVPIANMLLVSDMAEILRMMITNAVILYALLHREKTRGGNAV